MPGRIIDKIALREDFDPWLPNIEKISTMRWVKEFLVNSLGERKKTWPSSYQPIAYV